MVEAMCISQCGNVECYYFCFFVFLHLRIPHPSPTPNHPCQTQVSSCSDWTPRFLSASLHLLCLTLPFRVSFLLFLWFPAISIIVLANDILLCVIIMVYICFPPVPTAPLWCLTHCHTHNTSGCLGNRPQWPFPEVMRDGLSEESKQVIVASWQGNFGVLCGLWASQPFEEGQKDKNCIYILPLISRESQEKWSRESHLQIVRATVLLLWVLPPGPSFSHAPATGAGGLALEFSQGDHLENMCSSY